MRAFGVLCRNPNRGHPSRAAREPGSRMGADDAETSVSRELPPPSNGLRAAGHGSRIGARRTSAGTEGCRMIVRSHWSLAVPCLGAMALSMCSTAPSSPPGSESASSTERSSSAIGQGPSALFIGGAEEGSRLLLAQGKHIFRFDTFGDEAFWSDRLQLQRAVAALSPQDALGLGLKVSIETLLDGDGRSP